MIVRELENDFVMIEQHNHAKVSGEILSMWIDKLFHGNTYRSAVEYAAYYHDIGWQAFDRPPYWDDKKNKPYSFLDFPTAAKLVLYEHGINYVQQNNPYAALLCSEHYTRFLLHDDSATATSFVNLERMRQCKIKRNMSNFDEGLFDFHYKTLQLCDNLSLYLCLNHPGATKDNEHHFFRNGISFTPMLNPFKTDLINLYWIDKNTISMDVFPFDSPLSLKLIQKTISKKNIQKQGLVEAYEAKPYEALSITLKS